MGYMRSPSAVRSPLVGRSSSLLGTSSLSGTSSLVGTSSLSGTSSNFLQRTTSVEEEKHEAVAAEADEAFQNLLKRFAKDGPDAPLDSQLPSQIAPSYTRTVVHHEPPPGIMEAEFAIHVKMLEDRMEEFTQLATRLVEAQELIGSKEEGNRDPKGHAPLAEEKPVAPDSAVSRSVSTNAPDGAVALDSTAHEHNADVADMRFHENISRAWVLPGQACRY